MKQFIYILSIIISVILTSCEGLPNGDMDINGDNSGNRVLMSVYNTRNLANGNTETLSGKVGTFMYQNSNPLRSNIPYNVYSDGTMDPVKDALYYPYDGSSTTIHAYYPYDERISSEFPVYYITDWNDQYVDEWKYDLFVATPVPNRNNLNKNVTLDFYHAFCRVEFNISVCKYCIMKEDNLKGLSMTISNINQPVGYDIISQNIIYTENTGSINKNLNLIVSEDGKNAHAVVPPEKTGIYRPQNREITIKTRDNKEYKYKIPDDIIFETGKKYVWDVELFDNYIIVTAKLEENIPYGGEF